MTNRGTSLAPLREHNFRWYYAAEGVNLAGTTMNGVALAFAVLEISDSPSALGAVLAAHSIPMVVFLLLGGVIADRFGRALVIQVGNVLSGVTQLAIAALVLTGTGQLWQLIVLSAINGVVSAMSFPAFASLVPQLVPRDQLQPANALIALQRNALFMLGPAVAGILVVTIGAGWAVAFDGATYLLAALLLVRVKIPPPLPREDSRRDVGRPARGLGLLRRDDVALGDRRGVRRAQRAVQPGRSAPWARCWPRRRRSGSPAGA